MKRILALGAGRSAPFLIRYLLDRSEAAGWSVTVADRDRAEAARQVGDHPRGEAVGLEADDLEARSRAVASADLVINLLPPAFQVVVARECLAHRVPMVSASYRDARILELEEEAHREGVLFITEVGLDPGIDLMSAMELIDRLRSKGARVESFLSYGSGVPAPDSISNPLRYAVTWNPRNVVMAAEDGVQYLRDGRIRIVPWHRVFRDTWLVEVDGVGPMEAYPNRDSVLYRDSFGLPDVETLIRGTLRYPGWCETWLQLVRLGLPNEIFPLPGIDRLSYGDLVETFLPPGGARETLEARVARVLGLSPTGRVMENLRWLGLFSDEPIGGPEKATPAAALVRLLTQKLTLPPGGRDMIVLLHDLTLVYPDEGGRRERVVSTLVEHGEPGGMTAMARTVGLPVALAAKVVLAGEIDATGCPLPTDPRIYRPMLRELAAEGIRFSERSTPL